MFTNTLEDQFKALNLPPNHPRLLLVVPMIDCLAADRSMSTSEGQAVENFARERLDCDRVEMLQVREWLATPPRESLVEGATRLLVELFSAPDANTFEPNTAHVVLSEAATLLRRREVDHQMENPRGRARLVDYESIFGIDLGLSWLDIAPEIFQAQPQETARKNEQSSADSAPVRRLLTARRTDSADHPKSGGLV